MRGTSPIIAGGNTSGDSYMQMVGLENILKMLMDGNQLQ